MHHDHFFYKRNLPHYQPPGGEFFITFRLANSLPTSAIEKLKMERKKSMKNLKEQQRPYKSSDISILDKRYFQKFDRLLDRCNTGRHWLKEEPIAAIVSNKIHELDGIRYNLICYCIMPNHVHLLIGLPEFSKRDKSRSTFPVTKILRLIKGNTAYKINRVLGRTGQLWQHESYDHLVRDDNERSNIIRYTLLNPTSARLTKNWKDWKWSYCKKEYLQAM